VPAHCDATSPGGTTLAITNVSWLEDGVPAFPVSCGLHYARLPRQEWAVALRRLRAGGCTMVQTYLFGIHHEEQRGVWRWGRRRDLGRSVREAAAAGLRVLVRAGPWSHGEARGGGFPDWLEDLGRNGTVRLRTTDPAFLALARGFFERQAAQLAGLWWHQGGPIVGVQLSNEYVGPAEYLLALRGLALAASMCPPFFFITGWPPTTTPLPPGSLVPLVGGYVDEF